MVVAVSGWLAQEAPRSAWTLAAVGAGLLLIQALMAPFIGLLPLSQEGLLGVFGLIGEGVFVGWVLLVVALRAGTAVDRIDPRRRDGRRYARSTGSDDARFRSRLRPSSTCSVVA